MSEVGVLDSAPVSTTEPVIKKTTFTEVPRSSVDLRTAPERVTGMPRFKNEGQMDIMIDTEAVSRLLREEGLTAQQINTLVVTFKSARMTDVDHSGSLIGGISYGENINVFTSFAMLPRTTDEKPALEKYRYEQYHGTIPEGVTVNTLLHELKHYVQRCNGVALPRSWAAESSMEAHDELPAEKEAAAFADAHADAFMSKLQYEDQAGRFKPLVDWAANGTITEMDIPNVIDPNRVARTIEDGPEANYSNDYLNRFERDTKRAGALSQAEITGLATRGKELVDLKVLSVFEYNQLLSALSKSLKSTNNPNEEVPDQFYIQATV